MKEITRDMRKLVLILLVVLTVASLASCAASRKERRDRAYDLSKQAYEQHWGRDWTQVIELTTQAIKIAPGMSWPYSLRGVAYNATGKPDLALEDFDEAIKLNPFFVEALVNRGRTHLMAGQHERARVDLIEALKLAPNYIDALIVMSAVYSLQGNLDKSCRYMNIAVEAGFRQVDIVEQEGYFETLMLSDCYTKILKDLAPISGGQ